MNFVIRNNLNPKFCRDSRWNHSVKFSNVVFLDNDVGRLASSDLLAMTYCQWLAFSDLLLTTTWNLGKPRQLFEIRTVLFTFLINIMKVSLICQEAGSGSRANGGTRRTGEFNAGRHCCPSPGCLQQLAIIQNFGINFFTTKSTKPLHYNGRLRNYKASIVRISNQKFWTKTKHLLI